MSFSPSAASAALAAAARRRAAAIAEQVNVSGSGCPHKAMAGSCPAFSSSSSSASSSSSSKVWSVVSDAVRGKTGAVRVCVTGAAGQIAYSLLFMIAHGDMFGEDCPVDLVLLDIPPMAGALDGVAMELEDGMYPLLRSVTRSVDPVEAFRGVDAAVLVGAFPRKAGMERQDLLAKNAAIFETQGKALDAVAARHCKVLVVGNPANTNAFTASHFAPSLNKRNFSALTRLDHHRAGAQLAGKTGIPVSQLNNVAIWGNHSSTQFPDARFAVAYVDAGAGAGAPAAGPRPVTAVVNDQEYLEGDFVKTVQQRGAAIIKARKLSSAASAARATVMHMRDWCLGTPDGQFVSMAVNSDSNPYGVAEGVCFSFPVTCSGGDWTIVPNLPISDFAAGKLKATADELLQERKDVLALLSKN